MATGKYLCRWTAEIGVSEVTLYVESIKCVSEVTLQLQKYVLRAVGSEIINETTIIPL
jgi:hypothetical protein